MPLLWNPYLEVDPGLLVEQFFGPAMVSDNTIRHLWFLVWFFMFLEKCSFAHSGFPQQNWFKNSKINFEFPTTARKVWFCQTTKTRIFRHSNYSAVLQVRKNLSFVFFWWSNRAANWFLSFWELLGVLRSNSNIVDFFVVFSSRGYVACEPASASLSKSCPQLWNQCNLCNFHIDVFCKSIKLALPKRNYCNTSEKMKHWLHRMDTSLCLSPRRPCVKSASVRRNRRKFPHHGFFDEKCGSRVGGLHPGLVRGVGGTVRGGANSSFVK